MGHAQPPSPQSAYQPIKISFHHPFCVDSTASLYLYNVDSFFQTAHIYVGFAAAEGFGADLLTGDAVNGYLRTLVVFLEGYVYIVLYGVGIYPEHIGFNRIYASTGIHGNSYGIYPVATAIVHLNRYGVRIHASVVQ